MSAPSGEALARLRHRVAKLENQLVCRQQAEADQRQINGLLPVLVATAGFDGYYRKINAAFERILGWSEQELLSRSFFEFIHPADRAEAVAVFDGLRSGEPTFNFLNRKAGRQAGERPHGGTTRTTSARPPVPSGNVRP